jgi:hypothetical protein
MATYAPASQWNKNTQKAQEALDKSETSHAELEKGYEYIGKRPRNKKDFADEDFARNKLLNDSEAEQEVQKQRIINEYPKGSISGEGLKSQNTQGYGKEPSYKKGGEVDHVRKHAAGHMHHDDYVAKFGKR